MVEDLYPDLLFTASTINVKAYKNGLPPFGGVNVQLSTEISLQDDPFIRISQSSFLLGSYTPQASLS